MATKKGSKLNRTEIFNVRFDPILKWAAELAASKERRTLSSYTEWAVEQAVKQSWITRDTEGNQVDAWQVAQDCWSAEPIIRLANLARLYPDAMTIRERKIIQAKNWVFSSNEDLSAPMFYNEGWAVLCQYADDQISFPEVIERLRNIKAGQDKRGNAP